MTSDRYTLALNEDRCWKSGKKESLEFQCRYPGIQDGERFYSNFSSAEEAKKTMKDKGLEYRIGGQAFHGSMANLKPHPGVPVFVRDRS